MKRVLLYILLIITVLFFTACDAFFLPPFERTNPYDSEAPVAPVATFQATPTGPNTVELTWSLPEDRAPSALLIVRNANAQPENPDDGKIINSGALIPAADGVFTDTQDVQQNTSYWYGVWSAYGEADASIDDYVFIGPVSDSAATTLQTKVIYPVLDGYEEYDSSGPDYYDSYTGATLSISSDGTFFYSSLILFELSDFDNTIQSAEFSIFCDWVGAGGDELLVDPITTDWDTSIDYSGTQAADFADSTTYGYQISVPASADQIRYSLDTTSLVNSWITEGNNYGLLLSGNSLSGTSTDFNSSEATQKPYLNIQYYE